MWSGSRLAWVVSLVAVVVLVATIASVLPLTHVTNKPVTQRRAGFNAPTPIGLPINVSLTTPVYVVGPQSLAQRLVGVGVPQSLIKPIGLGQLSSLPSNSIVVVDWSVIKPYIAYSTIGKNITLNLTSPAVGLLANLFAKGDLVMVNVSKTEAPIAELLLSYTMARGAGVALYGPVRVRQYLLAHQYIVPILEVPINSKYVLVGATAIRTPHGIAVLVGPVGFKALPNLLRNWLASIEAAKGLIKLPTTSQDPTNWDPCYVAYADLLNGPSGSGGVYGSGKFILIWAPGVLESEGTAPVIANSVGIEAVQDNFGDVFFYDSCILIENTTGLLSIYTPPAIPVQLVGDVAYFMTPEGGNSRIIFRGYIPGPGALYQLIGGFDTYKSYEAYKKGLSSALIVTPTTSNYKPTPQGTSSSLSFGFEAGYPAFAAVYVPFTIPSGSGASESIGVSESPQASAYNLYEINYTWYFNYYGPYEISNNVTFIDGFTVGQELGAQIAIPNYSPGNTYWLYLPFNAEVQTYCWSAWANMAWVVGFTPLSNYILVSPSDVSFYFNNLSNAPSESWISGYTIYNDTLGCEYVSLSAPS